LEAHAVGCSVGASFFARKESFSPLFCLVLEASTYNTIMYLNSNCFLLLFSHTCSSECYYSIPNIIRQVGPFFINNNVPFGQEPPWLLNGLADCCRSQIFTTALGTNSMVKKGQFLLAQKWLFPKKTKSF